MIVWNVFWTKYINRNSMTSLISSKYYQQDSAIFFYHSTCVKGRRLVKELQQFFPHVSTINFSRNRLIRSRLLHIQAWGLLSVALFFLYQWLNNLSFIRMLNFQVSQWMCLTTKNTSSITDLFLTKFLIEKKREKT